MNYREKVLWRGAGFSWKFRAGGAQWGRPEENARRGQEIAQRRGVRGDGLARGRRAGV